MQNVVDLRKTNIDNENYMLEVVIVNINIEIKIEHKMKMTMVYSALTSIRSDRGRKINISTFVFFSTIKKRKRTLNITGPHNTRL